MRLSRGSSPEEGRCQVEEIRVRRWRSSPTTKSRESRRSRRRHRICRPCRAPTRPSRATTSTSVMERSACWPGLIFLPGRSTPSVRERHRSREFIEFLKLSRCRLSGPHRDQVDPRQSFCAHLERNHSLGSPLDRPAASRVPFTPKHGSWLNLVEGFFSKFARSVLRHIRVTSKQELKEAHHGRYRRRQSTSRHPHLVLQARRSRLI